MSTPVHQKIKFLDFFPTPLYLEMPSVGIDISDRMIRFVDIRLSEVGSQKFHLKSFGEKKISDAAIVSGNINQTDEIIKALSEIRKEKGFRFASVSLPEEKGYLFKIDLPEIEEKYFTENIGFRLEENVPVDASKCVFDYKIMKSKAGANKQAVVTVVPNKIVEVYEEIFDAASMAPLSYSLVTQAVVLAVVPQNENETCLIVHISEARSGFGVVSDGALQFSSTTNTEDADMTWEKREALLKSEIEKVKTYWQGRNENNPIKKIILSGKMATNAGLKESLASTSGCRVALANVWINVLDFKQQIPDISFEDALDYAPAIGLALMRYYA